MTLVQNYFKSPPCASYFIVTFVFQESRKVEIGLRLGGSQFLLLSNRLRKGFGNHSV